MPPAKLYRIDQLKPKGYLSQIEDLSREEQALLDAQRETSRQLFNLLLSKDSPSGDGQARDQVSGRRLAEQERALRERVHELSSAVEEIFTSRGRQTYFEITSYTEQVVLQEARGEHPPHHIRWQCYLCEPMRTLGWSRRRAIGQASLWLFFELYGPKLEGELLEGLRARWDEGTLGGLDPARFDERGLPLLAGLVTERLDTLIGNILEPHLASWQHASDAGSALAAGDRRSVAESIARLLARQSAPSD